MYKRRNIELNLLYGVPQGSKLGPILVNSYIAPLNEVAQRNHVSDEKYAYDEQLILSFKPNFLQHQTNAVRKMEKCIAEIRDCNINCIYSKEIFQQSRRTYKEQIQTNAMVESVLVPQLKLQALNPMSTQQNHKPLTLH